MPDSMLFSECLIAQFDRFWLYQIFRKCTYYTAHIIHSKMIERDLHTIAYVHPNDRKVLFGEKLGVQGAFEQNRKRVINYRISPNVSTLSNRSTPSFWDQENILCLELKHAKSTNYHLKQ